MNKKIRILFAIYIMMNCFQLIVASSQDEQQKFIDLQVTTMKVCIQKSVENNKNKVQAAKDKIAEIAVMKLMTEKSNYFIKLCGCCPTITENQMFGSQQHTNSRNANSRYVMMTVCCIPSCIIGSFIIPWPCEDEKLNIKKREAFNEINAKIDNDTMRLPLNSNPITNTVYTMLISKLINKK